MNVLSCPDHLYDKSEPVKGILILDLITYKTLIMEHVCL